MTFVYQDKDVAGYGAVFPDLPGCVTVGDTLDELYEMAVEAASFHLEGLIADGQTVPEPMGLEKALQHEYATESVSCFITRVGRPDKQERINISLAELDLALIDRAAGQAGETRSAFLVHSALDRIKAHTNRLSQNTKNAGRKMALSPRKSTVVHQHTIK